MIQFIIYSGLCLIAAIILFLVYNSGIGRLYSLKKRLTFLGSLIFFCAFIYFLTKAYHNSDNIRNERIVQELLTEYNDLEKMITLNLNNTNWVLQEKQSLVKSHIQQLSIHSHSECDTLFNILINILSAFLGWVIVFTFRNKIFG